MQLQLRNYKTISKIIIVMTMVVVVTVMMMMMMMMTTTTTVVVVVVVMTTSGETLHDNRYKSTVKCEKNAEGLQEGKKK